MSLFLSVEKLYNISRGEYYPELNFNDLNASHQALLDYLNNDKNELLYGIDTGFGPHAFKKNEDRIENQKSLIYHLTATSDTDCIQHEEARAVLAARIHSLSLGGSGISPNTLELLRSLLNQNIIPKIPKRGSLSASGDLIPLSAIGLALMGENEWSGENRHKAPSPSNQKHSEFKGLPLELKPKEALSLTNGTSFTTALLALQVESSIKLLNHSLNLLEILFSFHSVFADAFLPDLHKTKGFKGPIQVANRLYPVIKKNNKVKVEGKRVQDIYSIRCIPQIFGSLIDEIDSLKQVVEIELNSLSDNPVYIESENRFVEGGNFYASHVSFAADRLQNCLAVFATWIERFIQYLYDPNQNFDFSLSLSPDPGKYAGLSGLGLLATHLTAEIRRDSMPGSVQSLTSNGGNQDIVPMGAISVLRNRRSIESLFSLTSIFAYSIYQAGFLKGINFEDKNIFEGIKSSNKDRPLKEELRKIELFLKNQ